MCIFVVFPSTLLVLLKGTKVSQIHLLHLNKFSNTETELAKDEGRQRILEDAV